MATIEIPEALEHSPVHILKGTPQSFMQWLPLKELLNDPAVERTWPLLPEVLTILEFASEAKQPLTEVRLTVDEAATMYYAIEYYNERLDKDA